ncbi:MAG: DUF3883 domain-containing protein [Vicinamibacterales bacterium]
MADPYVERGKTRRLLHPTLPPISPDYIDHHSAQFSIDSWRRFFEQAGAKGALSVHRITREGKHHYLTTAEFLGLAPTELDNVRYTLHDYQILPGLPALDAPDNVRSALAAWLEESYIALSGTGRRQASPEHSSSPTVTGATASKWVGLLTPLEWVPCGDGRLRRPAAVLQKPDAARTDAPVAALSDGLLATLDREGIRFGLDIPEVAALRRLLATWPTLTADDLTSLLRHIRVDQPNDHDISLLAKAMATLEVPTSDGRRILLSRLVRATGGRQRGALGGWTVSLNELPEALRLELLDPLWPITIPPTTTGDQAMDYVEHVWCLARSGTVGLANEVRDILPTAFSYIREDAEDDSAVSTRWKRLCSAPMVFAEGEWVDPSSLGMSVYFDDVGERRFLTNASSLRTATPGHLGHSPKQQEATARALGLRFLSSHVHLQWQEGDEISVPAWNQRFALLHQIVSEAGSLGASELSQDAPTLRLRHVTDLALTVQIDGADPKDVPINARSTQGTLVVAGRPIAFASDAAKELLKALSLRQRGDIASDLTAALAAIDSTEDFAYAARRLARSYSTGFQLPDEFHSSAVPISPTPMAPAVTHTSGLLPDHPLAQTSPPGASLPPQGASFTKDRALAGQKGLAERLRKALTESIKGELAAVDETDEDRSSHLTGADLSSDAFYREIAAQYERDCARTPQIGDPMQHGWDLQSSDPSGNRRLIEVKGKGCAWLKEEVVELTRRQVRRAFEAQKEGPTTCWYLYVVEQTAPGLFNVLPIRNPVDRASKWILRGNEWRVLSEDPRPVKAST